MSATANATGTPLITTVGNSGGRQENPQEKDATPHAGIREFCEKYYDNILPIIMQKARLDKRRDVQSRLDFGSSPKRTRRTRETSASSGGGSPARHHPRGETTRIQRRKNSGRNVFDRLNQRQSAFERLSGTYSPSTTRSGRSRATSDYYSQEESSPERRHPRVRERSRGAEESCGDTYSTPRTRPQGRYRRDHPRPVRREARSSSPISRRSPSRITHQERRRSRARRHQRSIEKDLDEPWTCEEVDPFTPRIRNFRSTGKTRMPHNVKTYDGTGDPEDHLKVFSSVIGFDIVRHSCQNL